MNCSIEEWKSTSKKRQKVYIKCTHHVNEIVVLFDSSTKQEGKEELVLLKERPTDITVETEGEVFVDILHSLSQVV